MGTKTAKPDIIDPGIEPNSANRSGAAARDSDGNPYCAACQRPLVRKTPGKRGPQASLCPECRRRRTSARSHPAYRAVAEAIKAPISKVPRPIPVNFEALEGVTRTTDGYLVIPPEAVAHLREHLPTAVSDVERFRRLAGAFERRSREAPLPPRQNAALAAFYGADYLKTVLAALLR